MAENPANHSAAGASEDAKAGLDGEPTRERVDRGLSDLVKRAMSAGLEAATRSKDDFVRVATTEMRAWLERLLVYGRAGEPCLSLSAASLLPLPLRRLRAIPMRWCG